MIMQMKNMEHFALEVQNIILLVMHVFLKIVLILILLLDKLVKIVVNRKIINLVNLIKKNI